MKKFSLIFIIFLFINGCVADERESVSVMEGDSVTLQHNTKIQRDYLIEWRFGDVIAKINGGANKISINDDVLDGRFRDRLQVNEQTGDLTITNITTQHSGDYQLQIINIHTTRKTFNIRVFDYRQKVKTVTVGDSLILYNNVTKKTEDEKMVWSIRHNNSPVAKIIRNGIEFTYNVHDERFRDRLKVDDQTRDLIITNIRPEDSGSYEINITVGRHVYTIHRLFSVNVKEQDQSSESRSRTDIITVIIIVILVLVLVLAVALAFVLYKSHSRTAGNGDRKNESDSINCCGGADDDGLIQPLQVDEGKSVNLKTEVKDIQRVEKIEWKFEEIVIAEINPAHNIFSTFEGYDDEFIDKLKLNPQTGDLNISDFREENTGDYKLKIIRDGKTSYKRFKVSVTSRKKLFQ